MIHASCFKLVLLPHFQLAKVGFYRLLAVHYSKNSSFVQMEYWKHQTIHLSSSARNISRPSILQSLYKNQVELPSSGTFLKAEAQQFGRVRPSKDYNKSPWAPGTRRGHLHDIGLWLQAFHSQHMIQGVTNEDMMLQ